jgi:hypothetical protein
MKRFLVIGILLSLLATNALALQEVAGQLVISVPIGGSNSSQFGLLNDGNQTINVTLRADGSASSFLSFPTSVTLVPKKLVYTNITATIPTDYGTVGNLTGTVYALQQGASGGQVQINVQLSKSVVISVYGKPIQSSSSQTGQSTSSGQNAAASSQGVVGTVSDNSTLIVVVVVLVLVVVALALLLVRNNVVRKH